MNCPECDEIMTLSEGVYQCPDCFREYIEVAGELVESDELI